MKTKILLLSAFALLDVGVVNAQTAYTYVQQNGTVEAADGTATLDLTAQDATLQFVGDEIVMTVGNNTVAKLSNDEWNNCGGELAVDFVSGTGAGAKTVTVPSSGYETFYSPFQVTIPSGDVNVYAPTYSNSMLQLDASTLVSAGTVVPAGTPLVLKNAGDIAFPFTTEAADAVTSVLSGTAVAKTVAAESVYTLGHGNTTETASTYGFVLYSGTELPAAKAYFIKPAAETATFIKFSEQDTPTGISDASVSSGDANAPAYNIAGQRVNAGVKGIVVRNGQKSIK